MKTLYQKGIENKVPDSIKKVFGFIEYVLPLDEKLREDCLQWSGFHFEIRVNDGISICKAYFENPEQSFNYPNGYRIRQILQKL
jgi:hypothetical protein